jgi:hypothetical protein
MDKNITASADELSGILLWTQTMPDPGKARQLRASALQVKDWAETFKQADRHGLTPLLYANLFAYCPEVIPETKFEERFKTNAIRNLMYTQELLRVLEFFEAAGIRAIPYKGPVLAASIYKNLALREFFDLDILVDREDVPVAIDLLIANGYNHENKLDENQLNVYLHSGCELVFCRESVPLELHWQVATAMFCLPFQFTDLWSRRQMLSLGESQVSCLSPEDNLLVLCVHAAKHSWNSLCWLVDIAELLRSTPSLDWPLIIESARTLGAERILLLGVLLAHELLSAPIPEAIQRSLEHNGSIRKLASLAMARLCSLSTHGEFSISDHIFFIRSRERWWDRITYMFRTIFTPDLADWQSVRLPALWSPLYRLLRPSRLLMKFLLITPRMKVKPTGTAT